MSKSFGEKEAVSANTPKEQNELLPCPFCGDFAVLIDPGTDYHDVEEWTVICRKCGVKRGGDYKEDAIAAWNQRAAPSVSNAPESDTASSPAQ